MSNVERIDPPSIPRVRICMYRPDQVEIEANKEALPFFDNRPYTYMDVVPAFQKLITFKQETNGMVQMFDKPMEIKIWDLWNNMGMRESPHGDSELQSV